MFRSDDAALYLSDFGELATWSPTSGPSRTGTVLLDRPGQFLQGHEVLSDEYAVTLVIGDWPGLRRGERLVIGGRVYMLRTDLVALSDGLFATVSCTYEGAAP